MLETVLEDEKSVGSYLLTWRGKERVSEWVRKTVSE